MPWLVWVSMRLESPRNYIIRRLMLTSMASVRTVFLRFGPSLILLNLFQVHMLQEMHLLMVT